MDVRRVSILRDVSDDCPVRMAIAEQAKKQYLGGLKLKGINGAAILGGMRAVVGRCASRDQLGGKKNPGLWNKHHSRVCEREKDVSSG